MHLQSNVAGKCERQQYLLNVQRFNRENGKILNANFDPQGIM